MVQRVFGQCSACGTWNYDRRRGSCIRCDALAHSATRGTPRVDKVAVIVRGGMWHDTGRKARIPVGPKVFGRHWWHVSKRVVRFIYVDWSRRYDFVDNRAVLEALLAQAEHDHFVQRARLGRT